MASTYSKKFRAAAVAGASALVLGGTALMAAPATAASADLAYKCPVFIDPAEPPVFTPELTMKADTNAPDSMVSTATKAIALTDTTVSVDGGTVDLLRDALQGKSVGGTAEVQILVDGVAATRRVTLTDTPVPTEAGSALVVPVTGALGAIKGAAAGTTSKIELGDFKVSLAITKQDDTVQPFDLTCAADAGQDMTVDTYANTPAAKTTTKVSGKYVKAKKTVQANVKVTGTKTGKATVSLKLGKKVVKKTSVKVKNGKAAAKFAKIKKKGKYTIEVKLAAGPGYKASTGKTTVRVK